MTLQEREVQNCDAMYTYHPQDTYCNLRPHAEVFLDEGRKNMKDNQK